MTRANDRSCAVGKAGEKSRFVTVLEIPPVVSPGTAVKVSIVAEAKRRKAK